MMNEEITRAFSTPHATVDAGGEQLAYWRFGSGPDVVLVHGWPLHAATFRHLVPQLAEHFTLHLFDLPGAGQSALRGPASYPAHAATIRRAIDGLGLTRYALLAHDSGGLMARLVAADNPRVAALVIADTELPGHMSALFGAFVRLSKAPGFGGVLLTMLRFGFLRRSPLLFGGCFADPRYADGDFNDLFLKPLLRTARSADGQLALLRAVDVSVLDTLPQVHARIAAPTLCIWGTDDPFFPIAGARAMLPQFAGGAELAEIAGAKLFAHEDHPEEFLVRALPFLERHLPSAAAS